MWNNYVNSGFDFDINEANIQKRYQYLNIILLIGIVGLIKGLIYNTISDNVVLIKLESIVLMCIFALILTLRESKSFLENIVFITSFFIIIVFNMLYAFSLPDELKIIWIFIYAPALLIINKEPIGTLWLILLIVLMYAQQLQTYYHIDYTMLQTIYFTVVVVILSFLIYYINVVFKDYVHTIMKQKKELKRLNENLQDEVKKEIEKNRQKEQYLLQQSRFAQMGQMLSMIAHQWRQPLNNISTTTNNLTIKLFSNDDKNIDKKEFEDELELISNYTQYLSHTIDDFKEFFKSDKPKESITLDMIINSTLRIIEPSIKEQNMDLILDLNSTNEIKTYKNELIQVILNIIKNSCDALNDRKIINPTITISTSDNDIKISDNAGGIDEKIINNIFDPYFSTKEAKNGTGLGLYISKIIVKEHCGGDIEVQNNDDGVEFVIKL